MNTQKKYLILVCTYNEYENIQQFIPALMDSYSQQADVIVIDDNSPDGTSEWIQEYSKQNPSVGLIKRAGKLGRGSASRQGYEFFLQSKYDYLIEIDADFSHDYKDIAKMFALTDSSDIVVGSRLLPGGGYGNYPAKRVLLSNFIIYLFRTLLQIPCKDAVQSFHMIHRRVFETVRPSMLLANGFSIYVELKYLATKAGFSIKEFPIVIQDRKFGESKLGFAEQVRSVLMTLKNIYLIRKQKVDHVVEY